MKIVTIKYSLIILLLPAIFFSCKKVINLDLGNVSGDLVIEGNVTNEQGGEVILSRNVPFTSPNVYPAVSGAQVSVSDNLGNQYQLTEGPAGTYTNENFTGIPGRTYSMSVKTGGTSYAATSTMPGVVKLDSITDKNDIFNTTKNKKLITIHFQDPAGVTNQYRFVMFVNGVQVKSVFAFNDEFIDGKYVDLDLEQNDIDIYAGDTVEVQMQCIDKPMYEYWYTLAQQQADNPGGQVAPANPPTNISPVTLGYFSAHTTQSLTLTVK